eukprot:scaffold162_cov115-Phaeocystis_antarctica.AAC.2
MSSATGTGTNVGIVSGAPPLATEWSNAPRASRAPYTFAGLRNVLFLRSSTATGRLRWSATPSMKLAELFPLPLLQKPECSHGSSEFSASAASSGKRSPARKTVASIPSIGSSPASKPMLPSRVKRTLVVVSTVGWRAAFAVISKPAITLRG